MQRCGIEEVSAALKSEDVTPLFWAMVLAGESHLSLR